MEPSFLKNRNLIGDLCLKEKYKQNDVSSSLPVLGLASTIWWWHLWTRYSNSAFQLFPPHLGQLKVSLEVRVQRVDHHIHHKEERTAQLFPWRWQTRRHCRSFLTEGNSKHRTLIIISEIKRQTATLIWHWGPKKTRGIQIASLQTRLMFAFR